MHSVQFNCWRNILHVHFCLFVQTNISSIIIGVISNTIVFHNVIKSFNISTVIIIQNIAWCGWLCLKWERWIKTKICIQFYLHNKKQIGAVGNVYELYSGAAPFIFLPGCRSYLVRFFCGFPRSYQANGMLMLEISPWSVHILSNLLFSIHLTIQNNTDGHWQHHEVNHKYVNSMQRSMLLRSVILLDIRKCNFV
jgi:hypothetical protein